MEDVISSSHLTKDWVEQQVDCVFELSIVMHLLLVDSLIIFSVYSEVVRLVLMGVRLKMAETTEKINK